MLKAIAIDDEPVALEVIRTLAEKIGFVDIIAVFTNAFEALHYLQQEEVDLLFLDIKMPDISGIDVLRSIPHPPMVIFTTAYSEHAVQSFELDAVDYLLKPFSQARLLKACNKAFEQYELRKNGRNDILSPASVFIKTGYEQVRVGLDAILYVEGSGNYVQFVLEDQKILSRLTMGEAEVLLPASAFMRIHRSFIAARNKIRKIGKGSIWIGQAELPIGEAYTQEIEKMVRLR